MFVWHSKEPWKEVWVGIFIQVIYVYWEYLISLLKRLAFLSYLLCRYICIQSGFHSDCNTTLWNTIHSYCWFPTLLWRRLYCCCCRRVWHSSSRVVALQHMCRTVTSAVVNAESHTCSPPLLSHSRAFKYRVRCLTNQFLRFVNM